jgi:tetratricopeptide (TPR) repeat protein
MLKGRYADAVKLLEAARARYPAYPTPDFPLAGAYAELGRADEAKEALEQGRRKDPYLDLAGFGTRFRDPALKRRIEESLRKAGLK